MGLLKNIGAQVYIDSMDNKMPSQTSGETATRIKEVIKHCKKFILLATNKAIESYWCLFQLKSIPHFQFKSIPFYFCLQQQTSSWGYPQELVCSGL
ncbi:hypothetical protein [Dyadobacter frigoris]|uniref:TIR domain-containing protein n=1 Tax=Dyadobacter frigoris TaxID=2576211 RepID=A0A4U6CNY8_9BACT|nr:hypothetical protein [Dyadobacter frigoris]TKT85305.1 hypothetical protein FDK13_33895 [Dyadobacter frigoris]